MNITLYFSDVIAQVLDVAEIQRVQFAGKERKKLEFTLKVDIKSLFSMFLLTIE